MKQQDKIFIVVGSTAVLVTAGITGAWLFGKSDATTQSKSTAATSSGASATTTSQNTTTADVAATASAADTSSTAAATGYKDGTYTATATYYVPRGSNSMSAKVTVSGGKVTAVSVNHDYSDRESGMYIDSFESALQSAVVGKSIDGLSLNRIGGATLTTQAFDDALTTVRNEAKA